MKRTALKPSTKPLKRSAIARTSAWQRRKPMKQMSLKRLATLPARQAAMQVVRERDQVCQFPVRLAEWAAEHGPWPYKAPKCFGGLVGHEPQKRSHGADVTDPDAIVLLCAGHNSWVEDFPTQRKLLGL